MKKKKKLTTVLGLLVIVFLTTTAEMCPPSTEYCQGLIDQGLALQEQKKALEGRDDPGSVQTRDELEQKIQQKISNYVDSGCNAVMSAQ